MGHQIRQAPPIQALLGSTEGGGSQKGGFGTVQYTRCPGPCLWCDPLALVAATQGRAAVRRVRADALSHGGPLQRTAPADGGGAPGSGGQSPATAVARSVVPMRRLPLRVVRDDRAESNGRRWSDPPRSFGGPGQRTRLLQGPCKADGSTP